MSRAANTDRSLGSVADELAAMQAQADADRSAKKAHSDVYWDRWNARWYRLISNATSLPARTKPDFRAKARAAATALLDANDAGCSPKWRSGMDREEMLALVTLAEIAGIELPA